MIASKIWKRSSRRRILAHPHEEVPAAQEKLQADLGQFVVISGMGRFELCAAVVHMAIKAQMHRMELEPACKTSLKRTQAAAT